MSERFPRGPRNIDWSLEINAMKRLISLTCLSLALVGCGEIKSTDTGDDEQLVCGEGFLACGSQCIDPTRDPLFCGAQSDCAGVNAGAACPVGQLCVKGECSPLEIPPDDTPLTVECSNCGFENGSLAGWVVRDIIDPTYPISAAGSGVDPYGFFASVPSQGSFALLTGFDGWGPGTISAAKTFDIPAGVSATVSFDYRAAWDLQGFGATQSRTFALTIKSPAGFPLQTETILVANPGMLMPDTGMIQRSVDLTAYAGQSITVEFVWDVPEDHTGPSFFQLDNVQILIQ